MKLFLISSFLINRFSNHPINFSRSARSACWNGIFSDNIHDFRPRHQKLPPFKQNQTFFLITLTKQSYKVLLVQSSRRCNVGGEMGSFLWVFCEMKCGLVTNNLRIISWPSCSFSPLHSEEIIIRNYSQSFQEHTTFKSLFVLCCGLRNRPASEVWILNAFGDEICCRDQGWLPTWRFF